MDRKTWRTTWGPTESEATERLTLSLFKDNSGRDFFFISSIYSSNRLPSPQDSGCSQRGLYNFADVPWEGALQTPLQLWVEYHSRVNIASLLNKAFNVAQERSRSGFLVSGSCQSCPWSPGVSNSPNLLIINCCYVVLSWGRIQMQDSMR